MIPVFKPFVNRQDMQSVLNTLVADDLEPSVIKDQFLTSLSKYFGAKGGLAFRDMYWAVRMSFLAMDLQAGDRIIISPLADRVYGEVANDLGLELIYVDVVPESGHVNMELLEEQLEHDPAVIILQYTMGGVPDLKKILSFNIPILEEVTEAFGGDVEGQILGSFGDITLLSLEYKDIVTSGGGAAVFCKKSALFKKMESSLTFHSKGILLTDFNASLVMNQYSSLKKYLEVRSQIGEAYKQSLLKGQHKTLSRNDQENGVYYSFPVLLNTGKKKVMKYARKNGVETEDLWENSLFNHHVNSDYPCPVAESLLLKGLLFPLYPGLKKEDISLISRVLATLP